MQNGYKTVSFMLVMLMVENCGVQRHEGGFLNAPAQHCCLFLLRTT